MKRGNSEPLTPTQRAELETLAVLPDDTIDTSDAPLVTDWLRAQQGRVPGPPDRQ